MKLVVNARFLTQALTGVQRYALQTSIQIKRLVNEVVFVAPDSIQHKAAAADLDVKIIGRQKGHFWEQTDLYQFVRSNGNPPLLNLANTAPIRYNNNYVTIHDLAFIHHPEWNSRLFATWYRFLIPVITKRAKHIFTVSHTEKEDIITTLGIKSERILVTYNGVADVFLKHTETVQKKKQILAVGTFSVRKNHDKLIEAFLISDICSTYNLLIVGRKEDIFKQIPVAISSPNIIIIDSPDDEMLSRLYEESEVVVSLSSYEGFGLPVLEGLYFRCKVLCSDIPVYRELFDKCVYFCNPANIQEISQAIANITVASVVEPPPWLFEQYSYEAAAKVISTAILGPGKNP